MTIKIAALKERAKGETRDNNYPQVVRVIHEKGYSVLLKSL